MNTLQSKLEVALNLVSITPEEIKEPVKGSTMVAFTLTDEDTEKLSKHRTLSVSGHIIYLTQPTKAYPMWVANFMKM